MVEVVGAIFGVVVGAVFCVVGVVGMVGVV